MKKKVLALLVALMLVFGLVACKEKTTTTVPTTAAPTTTAPVTTAFSVKLSGVTDAGFTEEDKIIAGDWFDLLAGVSAMGSDGVDYKNNIQFLVIDSACYIEDGKLKTTGPKTCTVTYRVVVQGKMDSVDRTIKISAAPIVMEFTETDQWDNEAILGTNYTVTETQGAVNTFFYWAENANVLGTTGVIEVASGKLIIDQESLGGVNYALQTKMETDIVLKAKTYYKLSFTLTSDVDRVIDIVMKAPNDDYAKDTHSLIEVQAGTHDYDAVFVAPQTTLYINIMTGVMEDKTEAGRLEFSNFVLHEGPLAITYVEVADFFKNDAVTVGTQMEYITGTDTDYIREFYYWDQSNGALLEGEYVEGGFEVTLLTAATETWGAQLQWNDITKQGTPLIKGAKYKYSFTLTSTVARVIAVEVTGATNGEPVSKSQQFDLAVGANEIVLEFTSLHSFFFTKIHFGNYGDATQTGTFTITNMKLFVDKDAVPAEEEELTGNKFLIENPNGAIGTEAKQYNFYYWNGEGSELTATATDKQIAFDITNVGTQFWAIQAKYSGTLLTPNVSYELYFEVESEVARKIQFEIKNAGFSAVFFAREVELQAGLNKLCYVFFNELDTFNLQINIGKFGEADAGELVFKNFVLSVPTTEDVDFIDNGDFADAAALGASEAVGWAVWTGEGYVGTQTIADGVMTITTTTKGTAVWNAQIQYNHASATMTAGQVYRVELDVNASVATTVPFQLKGVTNDKNIDIYVDLEQGDNHVVLYYVAPQTTFRFFIMPGLTEAGTVLVIDNVKVYKPAPVAPLAETLNRFGTPVNAEGSSIGTEDINRNTFFSWSDGAANWTGTYSDGHALVDITSTGNNFWDIQLKYRGSALTVGQNYLLTFKVNSEVARKIQFEIKDGGFGGKTAEYTANLVAGDNTISLPFTATFGTFNIQFNLGNFAYDGETPETPVNEAGLLDFSEFDVSAVLVEAVGYIANGDFATEAALAGTDAAGWAYWSTQDINDGWAQPNYNGTTVIASGVMTTTTTQTGGAVWGCQIQYNHATETLIVGQVLRVELDVNSNVATTVVFQLKGPNDSLNIDIPVALIAGDNHVVVEYKASQAKFRFFIMPGMVEPGTVLVFDNVKLFVNEVE